MACERKEEGTGVDLWCARIMETHRTHSCNVEIAFLCCFDIQKPGTAAELAHIHETEITKCLDGHHFLLLLCQLYEMY